MPTITIPSTDIIKDKTWYSPLLDPTYYYDASTRIGFNPVDGDYHNRDWIYYLDFDMPSVLKGTSIISAEIYLYNTSPGKGVGLGVRVSPLIEDWQENENGSVNYASGAVVETSIPPNAADGYITFNAQSATQFYADNAGFYGFGFIPAPVDFDVEEYFIFNTSEATEYRPYMVITYNEPPSKPTVITPSGGGIWDTNHDIVIDPATDPEGDSLEYEFQLSVNDGVGYHDIGTTAATTLTYDFSGEPETKTARIRVRSSDGHSYSAWSDESAVFEIAHNDPPNQPTDLIPSGGDVADRAQGITFNWQHNDPNPDDPQSAADFQWRPKGATTWNETHLTTPDESITLPGGTFPHGEIEWRVRTYDQDDMVSSYSNIAIFLAGDKPSAPTILGPESPVNIPNPTVEWSSSGQVKARIEVLLNEIIQAEYTVDATKTKKITDDLENNQTYTVRVYITNIDGLESDPDSYAFEVAFTPPNAPEVELITDNASAQAVVTIEHPDPAGTQPDVIYCDIYRRPIDGEWLRLFTELPAGEDYVDATLASGIEYEFYVRGWGDNGTYADSVIVRGTLQLKSIWLQDPDDDESLHHFRYYEQQRQANLTIGGSTRQFEGRPFPVADFNGRKQQNVSPVLQLMGDDLNRLQELVNRQKTLLYRDNRGRRIFCVIFGVPETDEFWGSTVPIEVIAVDYKEGM